jgi:hypothetical protein
MHKTKATKYVIKKGRSCRLNQIPTTGNIRNFPHVSGRYPISHPCFDTSLIWTPVIAAEVRRLQLRPVEIIRKKCEFMFVKHIMMTSILLVLWFYQQWPWNCAWNWVLGLMCVDFFFNVFKFVLTLADGLCRGWFIYIISFMVQMSADRD